MRKLFIIILLTTAVAAQAQNAGRAAAAAAMAIGEAQEQKEQKKEPSNWDLSIKNQITVGQTLLTFWAAGGDDTFSMQAFVYANANYKKDEMFWNNRLQLDYGFIYASSKPIMQKTSDRIYLESKWGYKTPTMKKFYFSANYDFKSQFSNGYDYKTPGVDGLSDMTVAEQKVHWRNARILKSGLLSPAYTNLALGIDYTPFKWLSVNLAPVTGGFVIVADETLRKSYSVDPDKPARFEFGAQLKVDVKLKVNDNFTYGTQVVLFSNYLDKPQNLRVNWDNRIDWKLAKYFSFVVSTRLIYDDKVLIKDEVDIDEYPNGVQRIQLHETLSFGFTYTIANKK